MNETQMQTAPPRGDEIERVAQEISALAARAGRGDRAPTPARRRARGAPARLRPAARRRAARGRRRWSSRPARRCGARRRSPAATRRPAGACRSRSRAACWPPTCRAEGRDELFGDGRGIAAGVWAPRGKARPVDGGVVVSGRWAFCSGITHADLLFAGCFVEDGASSPSERPMPSVVALPKERAADPRHLAHAGPARHRQPRRRRRRGVRARRARVLAVRRAGPRPPAVPLPGLRVLRALDRRGRAGQRARRRSTTSSSWPRARSVRARAARSPSARPRTAAVADGRGVAARGPGAVLRGHRSRVAGRAGRRAGLRSRCAPSFAWRPRTPSGRPPTSSRSMYDLGGRHRDLRRLAAAAALPRRPHRHRALPGQRGVPRAARPDPARPARRRPRCCEPAARGRAAVLARPARRRGAGHRARGARAPGCGTLWIGEMATFDAFALATAVGHRAPGLRLKIGPLAIGVRSPVSIALGGRLGGRAHRQPRRRRARRLQSRRSSPAGTTASGRTARRACGRRSPALRPILAGDRVRLRRSPRAHPWLPAAPPAARHAHLRGGLRPRDDAGGRPTRRRGRAEPRAAGARPRGSRDRRRRGGRGGPNPAAPGGLGAGRAGAGRGGARPAGRAAGGLPRAARATARCSPSSASPTWCGAPGRARRGPSWRDGIPARAARARLRAGLRGEDLAARISAYHEAGADVVGVVPSTAEDPGGRGVLAAVSEGFRAHAPTPRTEELAS